MARSKEARYSRVRVHNDGALQSAARSHVADRISVQIYDIREADREAYLVLEFAQARELIRKLRTLGVCEHPLYGETTYCTEMACNNYIEKRRPR